MGQSGPQVNATAVGIAVVVVIVVIVGIVVAVIIVIVMFKGRSNRRGYSDVQHTLCWWNRWYMYMYMYNVGVCRCVITT